MSGAWVMDEAPRKRVAVVEDEADLRDVVVRYLESQGFAAVGAGNGKALREAQAAAPLDAVVLDISLPGEDGLSLCRWLRRETRAGVIMATGANDPLDRVVGLEIGADDYLTKPYDLRELLARVRSVLRRTERNREQPVPASPRSEAPAPASPERFGRFRLDRGGRRLFDEKGEAVPLTATETKLVFIFADKPNRPLSRSVLGELLHGEAPGAADRSIDISIMRLRQKLDPEGSGASPIRTVRGEGYLFDGNAR